MSNIIYVITRYFLQIPQSIHCPSVKLGPHRICFHGIDNTTLVVVSPEHSILCSFRLQKGQVVQPLYTKIFGRNINGISPNFPIFQQPVS